MRIALIGDIAFFGINTVNNKGWEKRYKAVKSIFDNCDFVVGNLETPLTLSTKTVKGKSAHIKGSPQDVEILRHLGVTHVTLANNHIFDYGEKGLFDTTKCLNENGIHWYGVNGRYSDIVSGSNKVRLLGYCCYSTNAVGLEKSGSYVNLLNPVEMIKDIEDTEKVGCLPIVSCHWGQEHVHYPDINHVEISRGIARKHTVVIHGHHPHVIQGVEEIGTGLILYSQGNFCFDDVYTSKSKNPLVKLSQDNKESFICILNVINSSIDSYEIIPFSFENGVYSINTSILDKINRWSNFLSAPADQYNLKRKADIDEYILGRKKKRNLEWFIKRINYNSLLMIKRSRKNDRRYEEILEEFHHLNI